MAYQFSTRNELDFELYGETGGFAPLPKRQTVEPRCLKIDINDWLATGLNVPKELLLQSAANDNHLQAEVRAA